MATDEQPYKVDDAGTILVPLKLAHPLAAAYAERARAETVKDYRVNETIWVPREWGNALIDAGQVQVDPVDHKARQAALFLNRRNQSLTVKEIDAKLAAAADAEGGDADAATPAKTEGRQSAADAPSKATSAKK